MASSIKSFYKSKNILLTGGTGFIGVTMVEKLLRSVPEVGKIFMIVREKRGASVEDRKRAYFNNPVFERLKKEREVDLDKLEWVQGDITKGNLGMSQATIERVQDEVDLIIHGAAMLNFSLPLKFYLDSNLCATLDFLKIAEGCKKLKGFLYLSTAYSQSRIGSNHITESILEHPIPIQELIQMTRTMSSDELQARAERLTFDWYNFYMYSKNATENLLKEFQTKFPIAIYRPAIVSHSYNEPTPYFMGNDLGFPKLLMEANKGLLLFCDPEVNANTVPVDITAYGALAALCNTAQTKKLHVYNCTSNNHPCTFEKAFRYYSNNVPDYEEVLVPYRYKLMGTDNVSPGSDEDKNRQQLEKYYKFHERIRGLLYKKETYENNNLDGIWSQLNETDKALFPFDVRACDWRKYYSNMFAKQFGTINFPKFEGLTEEKRLALKKNWFYKN